MKHLWFILFVFTLFAQNPCNDEEYQRIRNRIEDYGYESISSREWDYFQLKGNFSLLEWLIRYDK